MSCFHFSSIYFFHFLRVVMIPSLVVFPLIRTKPPLLKPSPAAFAPLRYASLLLPSAGRRASNSMRKTSTWASRPGCQTLSEVVAWVAASEVVRKRRPVAEPFRPKRLEGLLALLATFRCFLLVFSLQGFQKGTVVGESRYIYIWI